MIYLIEDDSNIRKLVEYALRKENFKVEGFPSSENFYKAIRSKLPELIILDIMLPGEDGLQILKNIRNTSDTQKIPVIMLTAKSGEYDKVMGLDAGADDYITKPFGIMELISRIKAVLRRTESTEKTESFTVGNLYVCPVKHIVKVGCKSVTLALKEFELLCMLLRSDGAVLSRDVLLAGIWGYSFDGETRTVDVHIRKLRQKLGDAGECIETVKGVGYKIEGVLKSGDQ